MLQIASLDDSRQANRNYCSELYCIFLFVVDFVLHFAGYRYLENDFIVIQARLLVPCAYLSGKVPYKYIVLKGTVKDPNEKYLWEFLVGYGARTNRCLKVPKERCKPEGAYFF